jgi:ribonuclease HII
MARDTRRAGGRISDPFRFDEEWLAADTWAVTAGDLRLAGADEAGRGCLAGPLVAAAVVFDYSAGPAATLGGLTDSKQMTPAAREAVFERILSVASRVSWVVFSPRTIDEVGLHRCNLEALRRAVESLRGEYGTALVDGFDLKRPELRVRHLVRADYKSAAVAAASVMAKVIRDRVMRRLASQYPQYGFEEHVGYGTDRHREALRACGPCALHRVSFRGVGTEQLGLWDE